MRPNSLYGVIHITKFKIRKKKNTKFYNKNEGPIDQKKNIAILPDK